MLQLPYEAQARILRHLTRDFHNLPMNARRLHAIVERELSEENYEYSNKVARIILLKAFARSLQDAGLRTLPQTERLLNCCQRFVPRLLALAVDDHLGLISA